MTYHCNIERDGDMFLVDSPDLPNVLTFGNTHEHALQMAKEALDAVLEAEVAQGLPASPPEYSGGHPVTVANHIALAIRLRSLRGERSQTEIASSLGMSYQAYQRLENPRKANPTVKTLEKIAHAYGRELTISL